MLDLLWMLITAGAILNVIYDLFNVLRGKLLTKWEQVLMLAIALMFFIQLYCKEFVYK